MCTMIAMKTAVDGAARGSSGWFKLTQATVGYDHATHTAAEHALLIDFQNPSMGPGARVAVEMNIASGKLFIEQLQAAIAAAEKSGVAE